MSTSPQVYIHLTDKQGALGIQKTKTLWASSIVEGVYAVAVGGTFVPDVQMTRLGRAKSRLTAVYFTTPLLPDYCTPEECVWKHSEIPVTIVKIANALQARRDLDSSLGVLNKDSYRERLMIPTKEMPDPENPPDFLIDENLETPTIKALVENLVENVLLGLSEEIEEAAKTPEQAAQANLALYGIFLGDVIHLYLFDKSKLTTFIELRDLLRESNAVFDRRLPEILPPDQAGKITTSEQVKAYAEQLLGEILLGTIAATVAFERSQNNEKIWRVTQSSAEKGYGPLLYEAMMTFINGDWIAPDASSVSPSAEKVWSTFAKRPDMQKEPSKQENHRHDPDEAPDLTFIYKPKGPRDTSAHKKLLNNADHPSNQLTNPGRFFSQIGSKFFSKKYQAAIRDGH